MNVAMRNLVGTEVRKSPGGGALDLVLRWREAGTHWRHVQAETYRIAARICECSEHASWCTDPQANPGSLGRGLLGTSIRIELAEGTEAEMTLARILVEQVVKQAVADSRE
jgi:hypothetical protein